jgi:hypothetical protein
MQVHAEMMALSFVIFIFLLVVDIRGGFFPATSYHREHSERLQDRWSGNFCAGFLLVRFPHFFGLARNFRRPAS